MWLIPNWFTGASLHDAIREGFEFNYGGLILIPFSNSSTLEGLHRALIFSLSNVVRDIVDHKSVHIRNIFI